MSNSINKRGAVGGTNRVDSKLRGVRRHGGIMG